MRVFSQEQEEMQSTANSSKAAESRSQQWGKNFRQWVRDWQYADTSGGRVILSFTAIGNAIGVSGTTVKAWWNGSSYPDRPNARRVAKTLGQSISDVYEAAGWGKDNTANTPQDIVKAVQDAEIPDEERDRLLNALTTMMRPAWRIRRPTWINLIQTALEEDKDPVEIARIIASIIAISYEELP
jgi:DNA-binding XRE family transcriptional regulator